MWYAILAGGIPRTGTTSSPALPKVVAHNLSRRLFEEGVFAQSIGYPTVPVGKARVRTIMTATHTRQDLERALEIFGKVGKELGII